MIKLVVFDVDGVLTDGTLWINGSGEVFKGFNVQDGIAFSLLKIHGLKTGILSGKSSESLAFRANQLSVDYLVMGESEKQQAFEEMAREASLRLDEIAYVGDDVIDLQIAGHAGLFLCPSDAHSLIRENADVVLDRAGGRGVARAAAEHILLLSGLDLNEIYNPLLDNLGKANVQQ